MSIVDLIANLKTRMAEIDSAINHADRPPDGDDYNLLYDAVLDEIRAAEGKE
jgi:hypothetical protein